jgi:hypothetical protein
MDRAMTLICDNLLDEFVPEFGDEHHLRVPLAYAESSRPDMSTTILRVHQPHAGKERSWYPRIRKFLKPFKVFSKKATVFSRRCRAGAELIGDVLD